MSDIILSYSDINMILEYGFFLSVVLSEFFERTIFLFLEYTVEVGKVVETTFVTDFSDGHGGVYQQAAGKTDADVNDVIRQRFSGA